MHVVTIIAANYAHFARALANSFLANNPGSKFFALLIDVDGHTYDPTVKEPFSVLTPGDLSLDRDEFLRMALMYDVTELATALKPWALEKLLDLGADVAVYLDPDIYVYAALDNVEEAARKHGIVLTPHGTSPMARDGKQPAEADIMQSGIYNLGFIAINQTNRDFLAWWQARLSRDSISAPEEMLFTDQRWIDFVPGYWDATILRDSGLNVAYWNVDKRTLSERDGAVYVDGKPLQFYHFSGFNPRTPWLLSKHAQGNPRVLVSEFPILTRLCEEYSVALSTHGVAASDVEYAFGRLSTGHKITQTLRRMYRERIIAEDALGVRTLPVPFSGNDAEIIAELTAPLPNQPLLNEFMMRAWHKRPDLAIAFPDPMNRDGRDLSDWCRTSGIAENLLEDWQLLPPRKAPRTAARRNEVSQRGVNLHGYLTAELGMGELARLVVRATEFAGIPHTTVVNNRHLSRSDADFTSTKSEERFPIDIVVINADQIQHWSDESLSTGEPRRLRVAVWAWEVEEFPAKFDRAFDFVDEVWAISRFTQEAIQRRTKKPVFTVPLPQQARNPDAYRPLDLGSLGLPTKPYFLVMFDFLSVIDRKNPFAAIDAFTRAFAPHEDVQLIIKTINGDRSVIDRERLRHAARGDERIHIIEDYLTSDEVLELMIGSLAYVSLHRSEGYGLTCSEAMGLGVPVIATGYSGNVDFMNEENSLLVPYELIAVDPSVGVYPPTTVWADADVTVAAQYMRRIVDEPEFAAEVGRAGYLSIRDSDTLGQAATFVATRVNFLMKHHEAVMRRAARSGNPLWQVARRLPSPVKSALKRVARSIRQRPQN